MCLSPLVDRILCVSPELRSGLRARGAPERKLLDFPNAIDTRRFAPITASERERARRVLELPEAARVVLHFGWSWARKGGDLMLAASERLSDLPELVVLTVLGEDRSAAEAALEGARAVRALPPTNDVRGLYAAADVFLNCSRAEGMPFAVLEALACGLPVVVSDLPAQRELLASLPGAVTVPPEPAAIARAIRQTLRLSAAQRAEHAQSAAARIRASFALEAWAHRLVDLYERAAERR
jgi:glycosyltransferase involved in cell wall biosynthesis